MEIFKTIKDTSVAEIVEKKSRFIAQIFHVETIEEAERKIGQVKKQYHDAKHNCFAYAIETGDGGIAVKFNDDGEPRRYSRVSDSKSHLGIEFIKCFSCSNKILWRSSFGYRRTCKSLHRSNPKGNRTEHFNKSNKRI